MTVQRSMMGWALALLLMGWAPRSGAAQDVPSPQPELPPAPEAGAPAPDAQPGNASPPTELVFEREVFEYPSFARRNPFLPLNAAEAGAPRFEDLTLIGIVFSEDPRSSVAVLSTGGVAIAEDGTTSPVEGDAFYLKVGQRIGNVTVVEIRRQEVVVNVEEFGLTDRRTMGFISR